MTDMATPAREVLDSPLGPGLQKVISGNPNPQELAVAVSLLLAMARRPMAALPTERSGERAAEAVLEFEGRRRSAP